MFHSILVATDFSGCADRAVRLAAAWAGRLGASLEIVHVFEHPTKAVPSGGLWVAPEVVAAHGKELGTRLEAVVALARADVERTTGVLLQGRPHAAIVAHAQARGVDLVVVGTRGLGAIAGTLLGSVADRVARTASSSVLVVPDQDRGALVPRTLVLPTDLSETASRTVERGLELARSFGAAAEIVHAWEPPPDAPRRGPIAEDVEGAALAAVRAAHPRTAGVRVGHLVREGAPTDAILARVDEVHADLVVMAPSGRRSLSRWLLGGVTERVLRSAPVPVLVLRGK